MGDEVTAETVERRQLPATVPQLGAYELATIPDEEFDQRLAALQKSQARVRQIKASLMTPEVHYGVIPGTGDKPTLLKAGSELLCSVYGLRPDFKPMVTYGDGASRPHIAVTMRCELHLGDLKGPVVAVGYGMANSWERKHRYRRGERTCPSCGLVGSVIKGKAEYGGGWVCWQKKGGCGAKFEEDAEIIVSQAVSDVENADPHDLQNTLMKMAEKRAQVDATLRGTASSDVFTQDLEEQATEPRKAEPVQGPADEPAQEREPGEDDEAPPPSQSQSCPFCGSAEFVISRDGKTAVCAQKECQRGWNLGR